MSFGAHGHVQVGPQYHKEWALPVSNRLCL